MKNGRRTEEKPKEYSFKALYETIVEIFAVG
jgi:hypothetical protein